MQNIVVAILTVAYVLVAYVGPVVALGLSAYWAYGSMDGDRTLGGAVAVFIISGLVLLICLMIAKRILKWVMNLVDLGDVPDDRTGNDRAG